MTADASSSAPRVRVVCRWGTSLLWNGSNEEEERRAGWPRRPWAGYGPPMDEIEIRGDVIRLGQLLKLAGIADSGAAAKDLLAAGAVTVNGEAETRRGRQVHPGDVVAAQGRELRLS